METRSRSVLLLGATFGTDNLGVGALTAGAITAIRKSDAGARIDLLDYGRRPTESCVRVDGVDVDVRLLNLRFSWKILLPNNVGLLLALAWLARLLPHALRMRLIAANRLLAAIQQADCALAISGGDSFSDIYGIGRFLYVALPQLLVVSMGKPLTLLPQTIGPFAHWPARALARLIMRRSRLVYSRDKEGVRQVRELLGLDEEDAKVRFCHDLGFLLEPHVPSEIDLGRLQRFARSRPLVGVNVSGLLLMGGYSGKNDFALNADYRDLTKRSIKALIENKGADVLLVPHVLGTQAESDVTACSELLESLRHRYPQQLFCVRGPYTQNEIKHVIGLCDFFVGARMHACIAAISQSVPAAAIAYSRKFVGVFESVGAADLVADPRTMSTEDILRRIDELFASRDAVRARLEGVMTRVRGEIFCAADDFC